MMYHFQMQKTVEILQLITAVALVTSGEYVTLIPLV